VVVNIVGDTIRTLIDKLVALGDHETNWDNHDDDGKTVESGIYLIYMEARNPKVHFREAVKYLLIK
jgi:flagellar hook assembly protein FlgD